MKDDVVAGKALSPTGSEKTGIIHAFTFIPHGTRVMILMADKNDEVVGGFWPGMLDTLTEQMEQADDGATESNLREIHSAISRVLGEDA